MSSGDIRLVRELIASQPDRKTMELADARASFDEQGRQFPFPEGVAIEETTANGVPATWFRAADATADAALLYLHGGGYMTGSPVSHRHLIAGMAVATGLPTLALDYRLGPEHPFPAAVEDAVAACESLLRQGFAANRLVIAGDSAGGGLALAAMLALRDQGRPLPAAGICLSPWVDLTNEADSYETRAAFDPILTHARLSEMAAAYLQGQSPRAPLASPLFADLAGLPPLLIHVGTDELLLDDALHLDARARAAGVETQLDVWDEMIHVWHYFHPLLTEGRDALARIGDFVHARLRNR
ncbi:MAG: alpha/beta hydrolase [Blastocatellia bacterium]|nr:alpha/beta hydrolase [Blastocatellia bacterium]